jgi:hypothetical protein
MADIGPELENIGPMFENIRPEIEKPGPMFADIRPGFEKPGPGTTECDGFRHPRSGAREL